MKILIKDFIPLIFRHFVEESSDLGIPSLIGRSFLSVFLGWFFFVGLRRTNVPRRGPFPFPSSVSLGSFPFILFVRALSGHMSFFSAAEASPFAFVIVNLSGGELGEADVSFSGLDNVHVHCVGIFGSAFLGDSM